MNGVDFSSHLVDDEIRRLIREAAADGGCVVASACAAEVLRTHPTCGFTEAQLADRILIAAASAGVAVQLG